MSSSDSDTVVITPAPKPVVVEKKYGDICLSFGKHKNKSLDDVLQQDPSYLTWLYKKMDEDKKKEPNKKLSPTMLAIRKYIKASNLVSK